MSFDYFLVVILCVVGYITMIYSKFMDEAIFMKVCNVFMEQNLSELGVKIKGDIWTFIVMLSMCGCLSMKYSLHYMNYKSYAGNLLFFIMFCFLVTMVSLVLSTSLITSLMFWEYLGLMSFFLMLFYNNYFSLRAGMVTLVTSRLGDLVFFYLVGASTYLCGLWEFNKTTVFLVLLLIIGSKSAFFPMGSWLLEAMRAPTPVSALVHSSTLVAAGVWFFSEYWVIFQKDLIGYYGLCLCMVTVLVTGVSSLMLNDAKKMVALSTSKKMSWCLIYMLLGYEAMAMTQLLIHGLGKCLYFMVMGNKMGGNEGAQNHKKFYDMQNSPPTVVVMVMAVCCLAGAPFLGMYYTKHILFSLFFSSSSSLGLVLLLILGFFLSNAYSVRLFFISSGSRMGGVVSYESKFMVALVCLPLISMLSLMMVASHEELIAANSYLSLLLLIVMVIGIFSGFYMFNVGFVQKLAVTIYFSSFGFMDYLVKVVNKLYTQLSNLSLLSLFRWDKSLISMVVGGLHLFPGLYVGFSSIFLFLVLVISQFSMQVYLFFV